MYKFSAASFQLPVFLFLDCFCALYIDVIFIALFFAEKCRILSNLRRIFRVAVYFI